MGGPNPAALQAPAAESDEALLLRVAAGDKRALEALYRRHASLLLAVALRMLRVSRDAEDALHDVFLEAWQRAGDYQASRASVRTWLLLRLRSRCLDRLRAHERSRAAPDAEAELESRAADDGEALDLGPDRARVRRALGQLPEAQRTALELAYFGGFTGAQIAERVGAPLGTIKTRLALGLGKLRDLLGVDPEDSR